MANITADILDEWDNHLGSKLTNFEDEYKTYLQFKNIENKLPKKDLVAKNWINSKEDTSSLYFLFNNMKNKESTTLYKKSDTSNDAYITLWLAKVTQIAELYQTLNNIPNFEGIDKEYIKSILDLSPNESVIHELPNILAKKGIILIYELGFKGMKVDGCIYKLKSGNPVIAMTLRHNRVDNFWFTLIHELSHILLHFDTINSPIVDDINNLADSLIEREANELVIDTIIERDKWKTLKSRKQSNKNVISIAKKNLLHPAILAGILRYERKEFYLYTEIINKVDFRKIIFGKEH